MNKNLNIYYIPIFNALYLSKSYDVFISHYDNEKVLHLKDFIKECFLDMDFIESPIEKDTKSELKLKNGNSLKIGDITNICGCQFNEIYLDEQYFINEDADLIGAFYCALKKNGRVIKIK